MMSLAVSSEPTCLPPLRSVLGSSGSTSHLPSHHLNNNSSGGPTAASAEEDDALPLLISMAHCANKSAAAESSRLPTLSSFLSRCSQIAPSTPPECATAAASPAPQPSPSSPSTLSPGLFGISTIVMPFSGSTSAFAPTTSPASSPIPTMSSPSADTYASATNGLMALSDIISSTPALPVPSSSNLSSSSAPRPNVAAGDSVDTYFAPVDGVDKDEGATSPVSSRTRRGTRGQQKPRQKQIEKVMAGIELERQRRHELEHTLKLALQERDILIAAKSTSATGVPRAHSMPALGESPFSDADLDISPAERSKSAPMLPPIGSIPALSPYLKRKRGSLPPPSSEELEEEAAVSVRGLATGRRRRNTVGQDDEDGDYEPTARKAVKRCRSMSEGGRRLQAAAAAASSSRRRSTSQHQPRVSAYEVDQQADMVALHLEAKHAKMSLCNDDSNDDGEVERSRSSVDIEEGPDQEDDYCAVYQPRRSQDSASTSSRTQSRRDSVLDFMKDHPHAAFWLKVRN